MGYIKNKKCYEVSSILQKYYDIDFNYVTELGYNNKIFYYLIEDNTCLCCKRKQVDYLPFKILDERLIILKR